MIELLTCSAGDYAKNQGRKLQDYEMRGVSAERSNRREAEVALRREAIQYSVVVDVKYSSIPGIQSGMFTDGCPVTYVVSGTALGLRNVEGTKKAPKKSRKKKK